MPSDSFLVSLYYLRQVGILICYHLNHNQYLIVESLKFYKLLQYNPKCGMTVLIWADLP